MAKKIAVLAVNPVNGFGLFQYLETFFENGISYKVFAVAETKEIKTNSGIALVADDVIAHLKGHEDEFDALVFGCGDAVPKFGENAGKPYNQDMLTVIKAFGDKAETLKKGEKISLLELGSFAIRERKERNGYNPNSKENMVIPAKKVVKFSIGKYFFD